jgi:putative endonuclease
LSKQNNKQLGARGESLAASILQKQQYSILEKNWRYKQLGEIDLIASQTSQDLNNPAVLVFIEVKTRVGKQYGLPAEAVNIKKQQQIIQLAGYYLAFHSFPANLVIRFDVFSVYFETPHVNPVVQHYKNAFDTDGLQ